MTSPVRIMTGFCILKMNKAVFVDTSAWFALVVPSDPNHVQAVDWLTANPAPLVTTDYIVDETLTLLRARNERSRAIEIGRLGVCTALAFDRHFRQFGNVIVVP